MKKEKENRYALIDQLPEQTQRDIRVGMLVQSKLGKKEIQKCMGR